MATQRRWPAKVRARALDLRREEELGTRAIQERLSAELGADVPPQTIQGWLNVGKRAEPPADVPRAIESLTARAVALLAREMNALEAGPGRVDVPRLERVARSLSVLRRQPATPVKDRRNGHMSLTDLDAIKPEETETSDDLV